MVDALIYKKHYLFIENTGLYIIKKKIGLWKCKHDTTTIVKSNYIKQIKGNYIKLYYN